MNELKDLIGRGCMMDNADYRAFIAAKAVRPQAKGLKRVNGLPDALKPFQRDVVKWSLSQGRCAIFAGTGLGKALDIATPVLTPAGFRRIDEISFGDFVIGGDGKRVRVTGVFPQGIRPAYRMTFSCGSSVICDLEHLWTVRTKKDKNRGKSWSTMTLQQIIETGVLHSHDRHSRWFIPIVNGPVDLGEETDCLPLHPYILGALIGDGSFRNNHIGFTSADQEIVDFIDDNLPFGYGLCKREYTKYDYYMGRTSDGKNGMRGGHWDHQVKDIIFDDLNLGELLSSEKFIPDQYKFSDARTRMFVMQGLLDTDGSVWEATGKTPIIEYCTTSLRLAEDFLFLVQSIGGTGKIHTKTTNRKLAYRVHPNFPNGTLPFLLSRKAAKWKDREKYQPTRSIRTVDRVDDCQMVCIKVENDDGLFLVNDCIVTHNTITQLAWAQAMQRHTKKRVIILTPLAVAHQTVQEAVKFGIADVEYAADHEAIKSQIVVTNYDRVEKFDMSEFGAVVLDESSIIKSHSSKTRQLLIDLCRDIPYRLCCTATPAPNDYVELGNLAEFLGILSAKEMLATWFVHDGSIRATSAANHGSKPVADWRLKGHAEKDFWRWIATWSVMIRHPRDIGYDDTGYDLPPLIKHQITVPVEYAPDLDMGTLFPIQASTLQERRGAARSSIATRVQAAADIVNAAPDRPWLIWCHLNDEADALRRAIPSAVEVRGSDDADKKTERLLGFANGSIRNLVTKSSIAGMGLNFQVCSDMIFVGLNDSFEQVYQSIRRCWRFGQTRPVNVYMIAAETEGAVVANLEAKEAAAEYMGEQMAIHMKDLTTRSLKGRVVQTHVEHVNKMELPSWM